jgi:beta-galactosidase
MKAFSSAKWWALTTSACSFFLLLGCGPSASTDSAGVPLTATASEAWPALSTGALSEQTVKDLQQHPVDARGKIVLNGNWLFSATWNGPQDFSAVESVPGSWKWCEKLPSQSDHKFDNLARGFYQKHVKIPTAWTKSRVFLDLQRISTDARVYVEGKAAGALSFPNATLDITKAIANKSEFDLVVEVASARNEEEAIQLLDVKDNSTPIYSDLSCFQAAGLTGDSILDASPPGVSIQDVTIRTSVRKKLLVTEINLSDVPKSAVSVLAEIKDKATDKTIKQFSCSLSPSKKLIGAWNWADPQLWQPGSPRLYRLSLRLKAAGLDDAFEDDFGFREFWIQGKQFYLNGKPINLRPCGANLSSGDNATVGGVIDGLYKAGFNCQEIWPSNTEERGAVSLSRWWYPEADRRGWLMIAAAPDVKPLLHTWKNRKQDFIRSVDFAVSAARNNPSIIMWTTSPNVFQAHHDPEWLGRPAPGDTNFPLYREIAQILRERIRDRPVFAHNGGVCGDIYSDNIYLCMTPLQEREEWLSSWSRNSTMPYMAVEYGTPLKSTMLRGRDEFVKAMTTEPWMTEYCAIYLGDRAYQMETDQYRQGIARTYLPDGKFNVWKMVPAITFAPAFQELQQLFSRNTWRSWRTLGITGGMVPWESGYGWQQSESQDSNAVTIVQGSGEGRRGPFKNCVENRSLYYLQEKGGWKITPGGQAILDNNGPYLTYIAHTGDDINLLKKDHHYRSAQILQKQLVLLNDSGQDGQYELNWSIRSASRTIASGKLSGVSRASSRMLFPIQCTLPAVSVKTDCEILLTGSINRRPLPADTFKIRIYPPLSPAGSIAIADPVGDSTKYLRGLGYNCTAPSAGSKVVIVGRNSLSSGKLSLESYKRFVENGGVLVLLGQQPEWWTKLGFRVCPHVTRQAFPVNSNGSDLKLDPEDLRDWNGAGNLVATNTVCGNLPAPAHGWHRSNQGSVSSACIEKPHHGSWRPLIEAEFDLAYSPLLVHHWGKGHVVVCSLDFEERGASDPAAEQCLQSVLHCAENLKPADSLSAFVLANDSDLKFYGSLGLNVSPAADISGLVIVGPNASVAQISNAKELLSKGRTVFSQGAATGQIGWTVNVSDMPTNVTPPLAGADLCKGLSASDLHVRSAYPATLIESGRDKSNFASLFSQRSAGRGKVHACQLFPPDVPTLTRPYLRFTSWRQTRCVSQLLSNLNVSFRPEVSIFPSDGSKTFYCSDYIPPDTNNFALSDDPYRWIQW